MTIKIYNTFSNKKEELHAQKKNFISMYVCGITPYDEVHLGHARVYIIFDIIKRHLIKRGYKVKHVQNFTDIDDKIIKKSYEKNITPSKLTQIYINDYFYQTSKLNILKADSYPCVTHVIPTIINFIKELIYKKIAYEINGNIYFSVEKFKNYGKLSKRNIKNLKTYTRINIYDKKKSSFDFVLWKKAKVNEPQEIIWESPWGKGRPGWHIECSAIIYKFLGDTIDIHGGGQDLVFPHHENEIAQSESKTGKQFVKYWIHSGLVTVNKEKMSKSLNNFFTLKVIFQKYSPRVVRYYLSSQQYSIPLDFSDLGLKSAENALIGIDNTYLKLISMTKHSYAEKITDKDLLILQENFLDSLDNNFNFEKALSYLHKLKNIILREIFTANKHRLFQFKKLFESFASESLGIVLPSINNSVDKHLHDLMELRNEARKNKDWAEADKIKKLIYEKGYEIVDNKNNKSILMKKCNYTRSHK
ncbi:MAG: cysteine--tRNA ligase [Endomicrobium sp.]|jgi:cysteinyl-tRNA synthetase|nr:cysteine--tRNA ligase [Endomicrobium sp.]